MPSLNSSSTLKLIKANIAWNKDSVILTLYSIWTFKHFVKGFFFFFWTCQFLVLATSKILVQGPLGLKWGALPWSPLFCWCFYSFGFPFKRKKDISARWKHYSWSVLIDFKLWIGLIGFATQTNQIKCISIITITT